SRRKVRVDPCPYWKIAAWRVPRCLESRNAAALGRFGVDWASFVRTPSRMDDVIGASADRVMVPGVVDIESQRPIDANRGMKTRGGLPGPVADAADELRARARRLDGHLDPVATDELPSGRRTPHLDLNALDGRIDV